MAPLWLMMPTGPSAGCTSLNMVEKLATAPLLKLARPCEFGPTSRIPAARAQATMLSSCKRPASPLSEKPELMMMHRATPAAAHSLTAATASSPGTAMMTRSGTSGKAEKPGKLAKPWTVSRCGLIAYTLPLKPKRDKYASGLPPILFGLSDAPMTAMERGASPLRMASLGSSFMVCPGEKRQGLACQGVYFAAHLVANLQ